MSVKIEAEGSCYQICLDKLGVKPRAPIEIGWPSDHEYPARKGCVITISDRVPREFEDVDSALAYLSEWLKKRDAWVDEQNKRSA